MTAASFRLAFSSWLAIGGSPSASASEVMRWWRR